MSCIFPSSYGFIHISNDAEAEGDDDDDDDGDEKVHVKTE